MPNLTTLANTIPSHPAFSEKNSRSFKHLFKTVPTRFFCPWKFSRQAYWIRLPCPPPGDLPNPGIQPRSHTLQADSVPSEPAGNPKNIGMGSLSLLQGIYPTQESNRGLLPCRQILYSLSFQGSD